jgi:phage terminase large subunit
MPTLQLPNGWSPRDYQRKLWAYLEGGGLRAVEIAHRRWGKDDVALHWTAVSAMQRVGTYWHMLPEAAQARKAIWEAVNPHTGIRRIDEAFPKAMRQTTREQEMFIRFVNGSTWQVVGSDNFNSLVGSPPIGIVFSEYALANPASWSYLRPILRENGGWAIFITTPRGNNHAKTLLDSAKAGESWHAEVSSVYDTRALTESELEEEKAEYIRENGIDAGTALFDQEYGCSFDAAVIGSYYVGELAQAHQAPKRITKVPYDSALPVHTYWDLGLDDATAIWFAQHVGKEIRLIRYREWTQTPLTAIAAEVMGMPYAYGTHVLPHDARAREMTTGRSREEVMRSILGRVEVMPVHEVADGINAVRTLFSRFWIDEEECKQGIECLRNYRKQWDEKKKTFQDRPFHDWASHGADALRQLALHFREKMGDLRRDDRYSKPRRKVAHSSTWGA